MVHAFKLMLTSYPSGQPFANRWTHTIFILQIAKDLGAVRAKKTIEVQDSST